MEASVVQKPRLLLIAAYKQKLGYCLTDKKYWNGSKYFHRTEDKEAEGEDRFAISIPVNGISTSTLLD